MSSVDCHVEVPKTTRRQQSRLKMVDCCQMVCPWSIRINLVMTVAIKCVLGLGRVVFLGGEVVLCKKKIYTTCDLLSKHYRNI